MFWSRQKSGSKAEESIATKGSSLTIGAGTKIPVRLLGPSGRIDAYWTVGKEVSLEKAEAAWSESAGCLFALEVIEAGHPKVFLASEERWNQANAQLSRLDEGLESPGRQQLKEHVPNASTKAADSLTGNSFRSEPPAPEPVASFEVLDPVAAFHMPSIRATLTASEWLTLREVILKLIQIADAAGLDANVDRRFTSPAEAPYAIQDGVATALRWGRFHVSTRGDTPHVNTYSPPHDWKTDIRID